MNIQVNGEVRTVSEGLTIAALLEELALAGKRIAVERNGEIVPRSQHATTPLQANDVLEVVHAIGGG